uniref:Fibroblast growth factor binding protein 1 n=1 Tax=Leptobrachium leishanense TaxID=445787 RepID=A0A8C5LLA1_9ANUR
MESSIVYIYFFILILSCLLLQAKEGGGRQRADKQDGAVPDNKGSRPKGGNSSLQGKFVSKDKAECVWSVTGTETVTLNVQCSKGETQLSCSFGGSPSTCPQYRENQKNYWKQITRALRKQKNICMDTKAVLKSKECKKGLKEAHLSYVISPPLVAEDKGNSHGDLNTPVHVNVPGDNTECVEDVDVAEKRRIAEEYCGSSWSSLCSFFISMLESKSC